MGLTVSLSSKQSNLSAAQITAMTSYPSIVYYSGGGVSSLVPGLFPVAIDGHPYLIDLKIGDTIRSSGTGFQRSSIPLLRNQADVANLPGEQSINPEDLWRRAAEDWTHGAGQKHFDRQESDSSRFNVSKGVDVWTKWQISLLNDTLLKKSTAQTNLAMVVAGSRLYVQFGSTVDASLYYTTTTTVTDDFTPVTGTPAASSTGITSDGVNVWASYPTVIHHTTTALGATTSRVTGGTAFSAIAYLKGRLMVADGPTLYNLVVNANATTGTQAVPVTAATGLLYTHPNASFNWVGFAEGQGNIYAAGYAGDKSLVYRTTIRADGTALDIPVVAGELPDGEIVRAIQGYLGFVLVGTDRGVRFGTTDGNGNITFGALIQTSTGTTSPVRCFEPQDRFVWFGYSPYDSVSTGLGRLDLSVFTSPNTPAYASDLMVTSQAAVLAVVTFGNKRAFAVSGVGFYVESLVPVASGTLDSGLITYGIHDNKVPMYVEMRCNPLVGSYTIAIATDSGAFTTLGTTSTAGATASTFSAGQDQANRFELRLTLTAGATAPVLSRLVLRSYPAAPSGEIFVVPVLLYEEVEVGDQIRTFNPLIELNFLRSIISDHRLVTYQEGTDNHSVFIDDYQWYPGHLTMDGNFWDGTCVLKMKSLASE